MLTDRSCCRSFLLRDQDFSHELSQAGDTADEKIGVLESFLMDAKNAIEGMYKDLVEDPAYRNRQANNQGPVSSMHFLHTYLYLTYIKCTKVIGRNLVLIKEMKPRVLAAGEMMVEKGKKPHKSGFLKT